MLGQIYILNSQGLINSNASGKLADCKYNFACLFDHLVESVSYKDVLQFK